MKNLILTSNIQHRTSPKGVFENFELWNFVFLDFSASLEMTFGDRAFDE